MPIFNEEQFWSLIDQARTGNFASASPEQLHKLLSRLSDDEIFLFLVLNGDPKVSLQISQAMQSLFL